MGARDWRDRLRCRVPGCRATIPGLTGLDELHELIRHFHRAHGRDIPLDLALDIRAAWEEDAAAESPA